jgi:hypothetical protein
MDWLWTRGGTSFGYREVDDLWTPDGRHVGRFHGGEVYGPGGNYLGELEGRGLLVTNRAKTSKRVNGFEPSPARRARNRLWLPAHIACDFGERLPAGLAPENVF